MSTHCTFPRLETYLDAVGQWRYRLQSGPRSTLFEGPGAYPTEARAAAAARHAKAVCAMTGADVHVVQIKESTQC